LALSPPPGDGIELLQKIEPLRRVELFRQPSELCGGRHTWLLVFLFRDNSCH
jgi:hypothetical protein